MKLHIIACVCLASAAARSIKTSEDEALGRRNTKGFFGRVLSIGRAGDKNSASAELAPAPSKESVVTDRRVGRAGPNLRGHEPKERVWNGEDAPKGEFPWMVLTAAHCVKTTEKKPFSRSVVIGAWNVKEWESENYGGFKPEEILVDDAIIHEKYYDNPEKDDGGHSGPHDIALLHLEWPSSLPPVEIAQSVPAVGESITVMGWGASNPDGDDGDRTPKLQMVELKVLPNKMCKGSFKNSVEMCTGDPDEEQNAMAGDSGGPFVVKDPQTGEWNQVGLVSRGSDTIDKTTDVVALKGWIEDHMASWKPFTTLKNCGSCKSDLDEASPSVKTDSAEDCWLDCIFAHVNDHFSPENLVAIDWYPDSKKCRCQTACKKLVKQDQDVVVIVRDEALPAGSKEACGGLD